MDRTFIGALIIFALIAGMLGLMECGRRIGVRRRGKDIEGARAGLGAVEGAIFGLMGLVIAFTFGGAAGRFDLRRQLIADEANAIGTVWLRLDLVPAGAQPALRENLRRYLDARLEYFRKQADAAEAGNELARANALQGEIWRQAVAVCQAAGGERFQMLLLPPLNQMFDITTVRAAALRTHPPAIIFIMLGALALVTSLLAGYGMAGGRQRSWIHMLGFAFIMGATLYVILDLEYPRIGLIRIDAADQVLVDLRQGMQ